MRDNPIHMQAFGADARRRERRLNRFFSGLVPYIHRKGKFMGAYTDGVPIGVLGMLPPGACRPTRADLLRLLPSLLMSNSPAGVLRVRRWLGTWAGIDPDEPHWHLGPLAVDPAHQGRGAGSRLMVHACTEASGAAMYLETDRPANVSFYERFGFRTTATLTVLGASNWLMRAERPVPAQ